VKIWVVGQVGVGKSVIAEELARLFQCPVLQLGKIFRRKFGERFMAETSRPFAPKECEELARQIIQNACTNHDWLIIDGAPRTLTQVPFVQMYGGIVVFLTAADKVRKERLTKRSSREEHRALAEAAFSDDTPQRVVALIESMGLPVIKVTTDRGSVDEQAANLQKTILFEKRCRRNNRKQHGGGVRSCSPDDISG